MTSMTRALANAARLAALARVQGPAAVVEPQPDQIVILARQSP